MTDHILIERPEAHPGVIVIRMNRLDKKNAITRDMYGQMALALAEADADESIRAVVLSGGPGAFPPAMISRFHPDRRRRRRGQECHRFPA